MINLTKDHIHRAAYFRSFKKNEIMKSVNVCKYTFIEH